MHCLVRRWAGGQQLALPWCLMEGGSGRQGQSAQLTDRSLPAQDCPRKCGCGCHAPEQGCHCRELHPMPQPAQNPIPLSQPHKLAMPKPYSRPECPYKCACGCHAPEKGCSCPQGSHANEMGTNQQTNLQILPGMNGQSQQPVGQSMPAQDCPYKCDCGCHAPEQGCNCKKPQPRPAMPKPHPQPECGLKCDCGCHAPEQGCDCEQPQPEPAMLKPHPEPECPHKCDCGCHAPEQDCDCGQPAPKPDPKPSPPLPPPPQSPAPKPHPESSPPPYSPPAKSPTPSHGSPSSGPNSPTQPPKAMPPMPHSRCPYECECGCHDPENGCHCSKPQPQPQPHPSCPMLCGCGCHNPEQGCDCMMPQPQPHPSCPMLCGCGCHNPEQGCDCLPQSQSSGSDYPAIMPLGPQMMPLAPQADPQEADQIAPGMYMLDVQCECPEGGNSTDCCGPSKFTQVLDTVDVKAQHCVRSCECGCHGKHYPGAHTPCICHDGKPRPLECLPLSA